MVARTAQISQRLSGAALALLASCAVARADGCGIAQDAGRQTSTFPSAGVERMTLVYVPTTYHPYDRTTSSLRGRFTS